MTRPRITRLPLYGVTVHIATDQSSWRRLRKRNPALEDYRFDRDLSKTPPAGQLEHADGLAPAGHTSWSLWLPDDGTFGQQRLWLLVDVAQHDDPLELVGTCAHEAAHAALSVFDHIGHSPPDGAGGNDEPTAYLIGWMTMELMAACGPTWRKLGREKTVL